jgi:hypothetical protein
MQGAFLRAARAVWRRQGHLEILERLTSVVRRRRIEVIDGRNCGEPLLKLPQLRVWRRAPRRAAARSPEHATNICGKTMVVGVPVALKLTNELVIGVAIDRIRFKEADLSGVRRDLGANPREILARLRRIGQDIN